MRYNKNNLLSILSLFIALIFVVLYFQMNTQSTMEIELEELQDDFISQKRTLSMVVEMMQEEREEKIALKMRQDSLQVKIANLAAMKDSLAATLSKEQKALYYANRQRRRLEKQLEDTVTDESAVSPLEQRYRSKEREGESQP